MRRNLILAAGVILALAIATFLIDRNASVPAPERPEIVRIKAMPAPEFRFKDIRTKKTFSLSELRGRTVLLNFWASWCAPCVVEFPKFQELAQTYPDTVAIIAVSVDSEAEDIERFLHKIRFSPLANFHIVHDDRRVIAQDVFQTLKYPETIIIDSEGHMARKVVGDTDWTGEEMKAYLSSLAPSRPIP